LLKTLRGGSLIVGPESGLNDELDSVTGKAQVTLTFAVPFTTIPHITATTRHPAGVSFQDTFSVTVQSISAVAVTFLIKGTDSVSGWSLDLYLTGGVSKFRMHSIFAASD